MCEIVTSIYQPTWLPFPVVPSTFGGSSEVADEASAMTEMQQRFTARKPAQKRQANSAE